MPTDTDAQRYARPGCELVSPLLDYVKTVHDNHGTVDYGVWHGGMAPLNARPGNPAGHYIGRILREDGYFYACPDDGSHDWDDLRWAGPWISRRDAALWLAGFRESTVRNRHQPACATVGCRREATERISYSLRGEAATEAVCSPCADSYSRRPVLRDFARSGH